MKNIRIPTGYILLVSSFLALLGVNLILWKLRSNFGLGPNTLEIAHAIALGISASLLPVLAYKHFRGRPYSWRDLELYASYPILVHHQWQAEWEDGKNTGAKSELKISGFLGNHHRWVRFPKLLPLTCEPGKEFMLASRKKPPFSEYGLVILYVEDLEESSEETFERLVASQA